MHRNRSPSPTPGSPASRGPEWRCTRRSLRSAWSGWEGSGARPACSSTTLSPCCPWASPPSEARDAATAASFHSFAV
eukprot:6950384-Prymnesium_polylepis.1